eukprot:scaffold31401_cov112-Isochrysis_galbana.AAC.1
MMLRLPQPSILRHLRHSGGTHTEEWVRAAHCVCVGGRGLRRSPGERTCGTGVQAHLDHIRTRSDMDHPC